MLSVLKTGSRWLMPLVFVFVIAGSGQAIAQEEADAAVYTQKEIDYTINTLLMFICAVLVLFMQAGFAMVEVGFNASKNAVNIIFKNIMDLSIGVILFMLIGYGLMYPGGDSKGNWFGFGGAWGYDRATESEVAAAELPDYGEGTNFLFQVAFAATAAVSYTHLTLPTKA